MKSLFFILFVLQSFFALAQNTVPIEQFLQKAVNKDLKNQFKSDFFDGDTLVVVQNFTIRDSIQQVTVTNADGNESHLVQSEQKILSLELKHRFYYGGGYQIEKQEVSLDQITAIAKDLQVLFETKPNAVKITRTNHYDDGRVEILADQSDLFFTHLKYERGNEGFGYTIKGLFEKAGYEIEISHWYD